MVRAFGPAGAVQRYHCLVAHQLKHIPPDWPLEIHVSPAEATSAVLQWLGPGYLVQPRPEKTRGEQIHAAFSAAFSRSGQPVFFCEPFCPALQLPIFEQGVRAFQQGLDFVLGTTEDSRLYLLGFKNNPGDWLRQVDWNDPHLLAALLGEARKREIEPGLLPLSFLATDTKSYRQAEKEYSLPKI